MGSRKSFLEEVLITTITDEDDRSRGGVLFERFYYPTKTSRPEFVARLQERLRSLKTDALWPKIVAATVEGKDQRQSRSKVRVPVDQTIRGYA